MNEQALFIEALEKHDPAERAAFLDQMCAGDPALRQRLERLLQHHQQADSFLESPTLAWAALAELIRERPGTVIGPYKLLQQIGEGGMGIVFMAEQQQPVRRKVALKIIKPGMDSSQVVARFEAERQALALMDHQNIARVLDAGTTDTGRPYFVMELVYGVPITTYCDDNHLTVRERLELFVPVCKAIQHAHQKGIIHRDLKPSNILVCLYDGQPVPKIIDFGVAKAIEQRLTERTMFTQYGQIIGTFEYMSPEQAEMSQLGVDTRSDIYSLGVLLYELLTGSTPFERLREAGLAEMLRTIKEDEPPKPSTRLSSTQEAAKIASARRTEPVKLAKVVRGELDWIVMKCLEKERDRRYETAYGLAMDVQRYLADEPVLASPPSPRYRLRKYWRKHRGPLLAVSGIVLLLVAGIIGTSVGLVLAQEKEREAQKDKAAALASQKQAMDSLRAATDDVVEQLIDGKPVLGPAEKAFLETTLKRWQAFADATGEGEQARAIRAEGWSRVASLRAKLGQRDEAVIGYQEAIALCQKLVDDYPGVPKHRQDLALTYVLLGYVFAHLGKQQERETALGQALALREKLAAEFPDEPEYRFDEALSHYDLGYLLSDQGRYVEAESFYRRTLALYEQLMTASPAVAKYRRNMAITQKALGNLLKDQRKFTAAQAAHREALAIAEKLVDEFPAVPDYRQLLADSHNDLGAALGRQGKIREAEASYRDGLAIWEKLASDFPAVPDYRKSLVLLYNNVGSALRLQGKQEAETVLHQALPIAEKLVDEFPTVPEYRCVLGMIQSSLGGTFLSVSKEPEKALPWCDKAIAAQEEALRRGGSINRVQSALRIAHAHRAEALSALQRHAEALKDYDKLVELAPEPERPFRRSLRAVGLVRAGRVAAAIEEAEELAHNADPSLLYNVACVYALASKPTKGNPISPELQAKYAERAIALLRQAIAKGYRNVHEMKNDDDLKSLRPRDDFQKLLSEMQK
jgi:serine/threonine protein kinase/tetratricopeptide (TPR) repeat protein